MSKRALAAVALLAGLVLGVTATATAGNGPGSWSRPGMGGMGPGMHQVQGEYEYLAHMIPHHQEAVTAAQQLARSDRREMRELGAAIVTTQTAEISLMQGWLATWYPGKSAAADYQPMMRNLSSLTSPALDKTFLEDMIPHHMMAVMMSQHLLNSGTITHPQAGTLARSISATQRAELRQMRRWLVQWFHGGRTWGHLHGPRMMSR